MVFSISGDQFLMSDSFGNAMKKLRGKGLKRFGLFILDE
jgi:hypothetical protein